MDDCKLKARTVEKLERKPNMFVSRFLSYLSTLLAHFHIMLLFNLT